MTISLTAGTPNYVLMEAKHPIGPAIMPLQSEVECLTIYGFSDKGPYDKFCSNSQSSLTPYPLVKGYLRNQAGTPSEGLKLVVIDAVGPREHCLHAATMTAVLEAQENQTALVPTAFRLIFDQEADAYRVEEVSV